MKKIKLLIPSIAIALGGLTTIPMVSCSKKKEPIGPLCFTGVDDVKSTIAYEIKGSLPDIQIQTTKTPEDKDSWEDWTEGEEKSLGKDEFIYIRNTTNSLSLDDGENYFRFIIKGKVAASGNVNSMINYGKLTEACYANMFKDCEITTAPELPATTLAHDCYTYMFMNCDLLTTPPELPATTLANACYMGMFCNCDTLTSAPKLPATKLSAYCYYSMFTNCSSLVEATSLPASKLPEHCYGAMFNNCTSLKITENDGTHKIFTCPAQFGAEAVQNMFSNTAQGSIKVTADNTYYWSESLAARA